MSYLQLQDKEARELADRTLRALKASATSPSVAATALMIALGQLCEECGGDKPWSYLEGCIKEMRAAEAGKEGATNGT